MSNVCYLLVLELEPRLVLSCPLDQVIKNFVCWSLICIPYLRLDDVVP